MDSIMPNGDAPIATSQIGQAAQAVVYVPNARQGHSAAPLSGDRAL